MQNHRNKTKLSKVFLLLFITPFLVFSCRETPITNDHYKLDFDLKKGEELLFKYTRTKHEVKDRLDYGEIKMEQLGVLRVLEKDSSTCTLEWQILNVNTDHMAVIDTASLRAYEDLMGSYSIKYLTTPEGIFLELLNWDDVLAYQLNLLDEAKKLEEEEKQMEYQRIRYRLIQDLGSKDMVEDLLIKEIKILHSIAGLEFDRGRASKPKVIPNIFGGEPIPIVSEYTIEERNKRKGILKGTENYTLSRAQKMSLLQNYTQSLEERFGRVPYDTDLSAIKFQVKNKVKFEYNYKKKIFPSIYFESTKLIKTPEEDIDKRESILFELVEEPK